MTSRSLGCWVAGHRASLHINEVSKVPDRAFRTVIKAEIVRCLALEVPFKETPIPRAFGKNRYAIKYMPLVSILIFQVALLEARKMPSQLLSRDSSDVACHGEGVFSGVNHVQLAQVQIRQGGSHGGCNFR